MTDTLERWEQWPVAALVAAAGLNTAIWYVNTTITGILPLATQVMVTLAGVASVVAIDGSLIATIAGMRQGRRSYWSTANIFITALFTALAALAAHDVLPMIGAWLHGMFALTIVAYLMHLAQPRADVGIALALRAQELDRREADLTITLTGREQALAAIDQGLAVREQTATAKLASADNYMRQCEQEMASRLAILAEREQAPARIEQVEVIKVASAELTWHQFERVIQEIMGDAPSMSSLRRLVASIKTIE